MSGFELKKFVYNKKNLIVFAILALLLIGTHLFILNSSMNVDSFKQNKVGEIKYGISKAEESLQKIDYPEDLKSETKNNIETYTQQIEALKSNHFNDYFKLQNQLDHQLLEHGKDDPQFKEQNAILQQNINYYNLVKSRHLDFELEPGAQIRAFGAFINASLYSMFTSIYLMIFSVLVSVQISTYFENKEFLFYDFAKIPRKKSLFHKVIAAVVVTFGWLLIVGIMDIVIVGLMNGFGDLNYPGFLINFAKTARDVETSGWKVDNMAIPNGEIILISLLYLLLILIFLSSIGAFLSTIFKKSLVVVGLLAVLIIGWSLVADEKSVQFIRPYVPMSYLNPRELLCNPFYLFGKNSLMVGVIYLTLMSIICYFAANLLLKKHKIRRI
ncbi:ABC transporter permease [Lactovum odontotermitis]